MTLRYGISGLDIRVGGQPMPAAAVMVRMVTVPIAPTRVRLSIWHAAFASEHEHRAFHCREVTRSRRVGAMMLDQYQVHMKALGL